MSKYFEDEVSELLAREKIRELRYELCRATDARDFKSVESCLTPDVCADYGALGKFESREDLLNMMRNYAKENSIIGLHTVMNPIIEFSSSTSATVHWICQRSSYEPATSTSTKISGTYTDRCVKTKSGWLLESTIYTMLFYDVLVAGQG